MPPALRALLEHAIDYAGLFPPAKLSLDESVRNFGTYRRSPRAWMLAGFVCPVVRLGELASRLTEDVQRTSLRSRPLDCCVIASAVACLAEAIETLRDDLRRMRDFAFALSSAAATSLRLSLEFRLPGDGCSPDAPLGLLDGINQAATEFALPLGPVFLETPLDEPSLAGVAEDVSSFRRRTNGVFGLKFRTGGLDAAAYPSCEALARGVAVCRHQGLPYKLTAGLHQPLRHAESALGTVAHGFLNVLVAAVLADVHRLAAPDIQAILEEEAATAFVLDGEHLRWRGHAIAAGQIRTARERGLASFGSCSFDEPVAGLRAIGWEA